MSQYSLWALFGSWIPSVMKGSAWPISQKSSASSDGLIRIDLSPCLIPWVACWCEVTAVFLSARRVGLLVQHRFSFFKNAFSQIWKLLSLRTLARWDDMTKQTLDFSLFSFSRPRDENALHLGHISADRDLRADHSGIILKLCTERLWNLYWIFCSLSHYDLVCGF